MKKAFSMSELALVLIIIGIIVLLTLKVRKYIDVAKWQYDIGVIKNATEMPKIYYDITGNINDSNLTIDINKIEKATGYSFKNMKLYNFMSNGTEPVNFYYMNSVNLRATDSDTINSVYKITDDPTLLGTMIVMSVFTNNPTRGISKYLMCSLEVYLDDKYVYSGIGRFLIGNNQNTYEDSGYSNMDYKDCTSESRDIDDGKMWGIRVYL